MDIFALMYYGAICGVLSGLGPRIGAAPVRVAVGVAVGVVAAGLLPVLRGMLGL